MSLLRQLFILTTLLIVTGVSTVVWAQQEPSQVQQRMRRMPDRMAMKKAMQERLELSDQQIIDLRKLRQNRRKSAIRLQADTRVARLELAELLEAVRVDEQAVLAKSMELASLMAQAVKARSADAVAARKIVSAEQWVQLSAMRRQISGGQAGRGSEPMLGRGRGLHGRGFQQDRRRRHGRSSSGGRD